MTARTLVGWLGSALLVLVPPGSGASLPPEVSLEIAVLPCTNIEASFQKFHPLFAYLKSSTGFDIRLVVPASLAEFEAAMRNGQTDFALQDPHTFQDLSHLFDLSSLLQTRGLDGSTSQSAVVIVRKESGIDELQQLVGKTVMFGPRVSSPKWVAARRLFESRGIDVDHDLKVLNGGCCEDIAFSVLIGSVDAGVICDHFLGQHASRQKDLGVDPDSLTVIGRTAALPTRVFAARRGVAPEVTRAIVRALLDLDPADTRHAEILEKAEIRGFLTTTRNDYLKVLARFGPGGQS